MKLKKNRRVPTLFALFLITIVLALGIGLDYFNKQTQAELRTVYIPRKINILNVADNSISISWQTDRPTNGSVLYSEDSRFYKEQKDAREPIEPNKKRYSHFVNITNLKPLTRYYFQIQSEEISYPPKPLDFKTGPRLQMGNNMTQSGKPVRGSAVDKALLPLEDALVFFELAGTQKVGTYTTSNGNFILSLSQVRTLDNLRMMDLSQEKEAKLTIIQGDNSSTYNIKIPVDSNAIQGLIIGQDLDLRNYQTRPPAEPETILSSDQKSDINKDGKINSFDLSVVIQNINKRDFDPKTDINQDGKVDQNDLDLVKEAVK